MNPPRRGDVSLGMRRIALAATVLAVLLHASPAAAGGSWLEADREWYEPGDTAHVAGEVYRGQLGWVEDGPFFAYLQHGLSDTIEHDAVPLGPLSVEEPAEGWPLSVSVTFTVPHGLAPGRYAVEVCNEPCTTGLGNLIGGEVWIGQPPVPETSIAPAPIARTPSTTTTTEVALIGGVHDPRDDEPPGAAGWLVVGGSVVLVVAALGWRRYRY